MEQCSIDEIIGDKRAVMTLDGDIQNFSVLEEEKPISILRLMPYAVAVKRSSITKQELGITLTNMVKESAACVFSMMIRPDKAHLGLTDEVMYEALLQQKKDARAFAYHNPENRQEMVQYEQFGFAPVSDGKQYIRNQDGLTNEVLRRCMDEQQAAIPGTDYTISILQKSEMMNLIQFVNGMLSVKYGFFVIRTPKYYEQMSEELIDYHGNIFLIRHNEKIIGYFAMEGVLEVELLREVLIENEELCERLFTLTQEGLPVMARIVNLRNMVKHICSDGKVTIAVRIEDPMIRANNGLYLWYLDENGSRLEMVEKAWERDNKSLPRPELSVTIGEFTSFLMGYKTLKKNRKFESIKLPGSVWLPERN